MSRVEELIKEKCPDGVEFQKLEDILMYEQPTKYIVSSTEYDNSYPIPVLTAGQSFILGYTDETDGVYKASKEMPVIIFDDFTTSFHWVDFEFKVKSSAMKMLRPRNWEKCNFRYLYYAMCTIEYVPVEHSRQWISNYSQFEIPVPPIEIQQEIVCILDKFTELEAELQDELNARKKQYEYYRDKLMTYREGTSIIKLGKLCDIKGRIGFRGYTHDDFVQQGEGAITLSPGNIYNNHIIYGDCKYITWEKYKESPEIMLDTKDVVVCKTGSTVGKVAVVDYLPEKTTLNPQLVVLKNIMCNYRYLFYQITSAKIQRKIKGLAGVGSVPNISQSALGDIDIEIPSIEEQDKIVNILDAFDAICNDYESGLPAEIEARHKQYEYYRDKLLTFERKVV